MGKHYKATPGCIVYVIANAHKKRERYLVKCKVTMLTEEKIYVESLNPGQYNKWLGNNRYRIIWFKDESEATKAFNKLREGEKDE